VTLARLAAILKVSAINEKFFDEFVVNRYGYMLKNFHEIDLADFQEMTS